jgi:hypothetical protein
LTQSEGAGWGRNESQNDQLWSSHTRSKHVDHVSSLPNVGRERLMEHEAFLSARPQDYDLHRSNLVHPSSAHFNVERARCGFGGNDSVG